MTNYDNWIEQSKKMHKVVADGTYLLCDDFRRELYETVMKEFIQSKISKTDFAVLLSLVTNYLIEEESIFKIESFEDFIEKHSLNISKPNLSRSLKSLETEGFVERSKPSKELIYFFKTEFRYLEYLS